VLSGSVDESSLTGTVTLAGLSFENIAAPSGNAVAALAIDRLEEGTLILDGDAFTHVSSAGAPPVEIVDAPASCTTQETGLAIEDSSFSSETYSASGSSASGGAGLSLTDGCSQNWVALSSDRFESDTLQVSGGDGLGGGLAIDGGSPAPTVNQSANVFADDSVSASGGNFDYGGGGEWTQGVSVISTRDQFTDNVLAGTTGASEWSWGAGVGILNSSCSGSNPVTATLTDDVIAGNEIVDSGADSAADAQGAGVYVGVACAPSSSSESLTLADSTVTANAVTPDGRSGGAIAGIDGSVTDLLTLDNTILYGDVGGAELAGFSASASSLTVSHSDFCAGGAPAGGSGNICANPQLGGLDGVQETAGSPTINAGSNALLPSGLTSDFFGDPRINTPTAGCSVNTTVDIGADQYGPVCETSAPPPAPVALTLTGVAESHAVWHEGSGPATIARRQARKKARTPLGTTFSFTLSTQATVTFKFMRLLTGRMVAHRCVLPTLKNRRKPKCGYRLAAGTLSFPTVPAGSRSVTFDGILAGGRKLAPGSYTVAVSASTSSATVAPQTLSFRIA